MSEEIKFTKTSKIIVLSYFLLWVILFEFILPVNNILPKPSTVFESFKDLINPDIYNVGVNYLLTATNIFLAIYFGFFLLFISYKVFFVKNSFVKDFLLSLEWFSEYIPGIVLATILVFWFPTSDFAEFIFILLTAYFSFFLKAAKLNRKVSKSSILFYKSLGSNDNFIYNFVHWKFIQKDLINHIIKYHIYLWGILIAYEFIKGTRGLGSILRTALQIHDISAIFSIFIITGISVYLGDKLLKYTFRKIYID